jgi:predicted NodU family carbamoyl transferase
MRELLLTLGHNSSAVLVEDGEIAWGYETERLSGVKSDSRFPAQVINQFIREKKVHRAFVTHWAPSGYLSDMSPKHWQPAYFDGIPINTIGPDFSHHDSHVYAAICYAGPEFFRTQDAIALVVDGFGILGEHFSIYRVHKGSPTLLRRYRGYGTSLGLWYQYATLFMGMKMHEDEYKLLGYEVHVTSEQYADCHVCARETADEWLEEMEDHIYGSVYDPVYSIDALPATREKVHARLRAFAETMGISDPTTFEGRAVIACYVQAVLEHVVLDIMRKYVGGPKSPKNLLLSGGVFMNVKLNKLMLDNTEGQVCVYPLCGDQGNAIGLYAALNPKFRFPKTLNWGHRQLRDVGQVTNLHYFKDEEAMKQTALAYLETLGRVNIVRGSMEFGARALCNTSTLALPRLDQVEAINKANDRNTVMPMAPVMTATMYRSLFEPAAGRVWKSHEHMIIACEHAQHPGDEILGIAHRYLWPYKHHTSRPQVTHDPWLISLLSEVSDPLINTSFNFHGRPIAYDMPSIIESHRLELERDPSTTTLVLTNA